MSLIHIKLNNFLKKYYLNECIKGLLLFIAIGLLYFFVIILCEHFLWLNPFGRKILFWLFLLVELFLFFKFIFYNLLLFFKLKKGLNNLQASDIIGTHFHEIKDKLSNFFQLYDNSSQSDLLIAAISQKEKELYPIPFNNAVNFKKLYNLIPFALVPIFIILFLAFSNNLSIISSPFERILLYNKEFKKPAPFSFKILNKNLTSIYNENFTLKVQIIGSILPENIKIYFNNQSYILRSGENSSVFEYTFLNPKNDIIFILDAQNIISETYQLKTTKIPIINSLKLNLNYPKNTGKKNEVITGSGNVIVPEGTNINWIVNTLYTDNINFQINDKMESFIKDSQVYQYNKTVNTTFDYSIVLSNNLVQNPEKLNFNITVIKDQFPTINVEEAPDSLKVSKDYLIGNISDDFGFSKLQVVYYPKDNSNQSKRLNLRINGKNQSNFIYRFPDNLNIQPGLFYDYYFEVFDNDSNNKFKSSRSQVFSNKVLSEQESVIENFNSQQSNMNKLSKSIISQNKQISELDKLQHINKQKSNLDFKDKNKIDDILKNQLNQEKIIEEFSKKLKENINFNKENFDKDLEKKLDKTIENSEKNQKLLEQLKEIQDKISKEDFFDKLNKLKSDTKSNQKNLEQLLELTKKFYVEKKYGQLAKKIDKLADKQESLSEDKNNSKEKQEILNKEFDKITDELQDLKKENEALKKPLDLEDEKKQSNEIKEDQQNATNDLNNNQKDQAQSKQKKVAKKMKSLSSKIQSSMQSSSKEQMQEDVAMLRQILDNLLSFSFNQEQLLKLFKQQKKGFPTFNKNLKKQQDLKLQFKHIDDSIFALALRNKMITEKVNQEIADIHYNMDKALTEFTEYRLPRGVSHQQYVMNSSNKLADMLSETLNNMQMQMNSSGSGSSMPQPGSGGGGSQLPDIIKKQKSLSKKVKQKSETGDDEYGEDSDESEKGKEGNDGENDEQRENGNSGMNGKNGKKASNKNSTKGENGKNGNNGNKSGASGSDGDSESNNNNGEENAKELFEILQEQKKLRNQLQDMFSKDGIDSKQKKLLEDMKALEKDILNKGFKNEIFNKMLNIENQMLKLENATNLQEEDNKRESNTNKKSFSNSNPIPNVLLKYIQSNEILQKNILPLNSNYTQKTNYYFNNDKL